jgi:hypothetical protein
MALRRILNVPIDRKIPEDLAGEAVLNHRLLHHLLRPMIPRAFIPID